MRKNSEVPAVCLRDVVARRGDGRLKFTESWIEDEHGNRISTLRCGQYCKFVLIYETLPTASVTGLDVAIAVSTVNNVGVVDFSNRTTGDYFDSKLSATGRIECIIPRLPLNCGAYSYGVFARSQGVVEDWIGYASDFDVVAGDFFGTGKLPDRQWMLLADHKWKLYENGELI